jgi:hypothetical protein
MRRRTSAPSQVNARHLAQQFLRLVRERRGRKLDEWVAEVHKTGPPELRGFSRNLRHDWDAVHAGLTECWSSGPVEGNVNKLNSVISDDLDQRATNTCSTITASNGGRLGRGRGRRSARRDRLGPVPASQRRAARPCVCASD